MVAFLSVAGALGGIVGLLTLAMHVYFYKKHRREATYQRQFDLVKIGIENDLSLIGSARHLRAHARDVLYANLWIVHWAQMWDERKLSEDKLRRVAADLFEEPGIRIWWKDRGKDWSATKSKRRSAFVAIITEECSSAEARDEAPRLSARIPASTPAMDNLPKVMMAARNV